MEDKYGDLLRTVIEQQNEMLNRSGNKPTADEREVPTENIEFIASKYFNKKGRDDKQTKNKPHFHDMLACLDEPAELQIVVMRFQLGASFEEIGKEYGYSKQTTNNIYHAALKKIKTRLKWGVSGQSPQQPLQSK